MHNFSGRTSTVRPPRRIRRLAILSLLVVAGTLPESWPLLRTANAADPILVGRNDADGDSIVNTADVDDDNDGIADLLEIGADGSDRDSDRDGMPDRLDLDSDNDGIPDWVESGAIKTLSLSSLRVVGARLVGEVGDNGMLDVFESPIDTGRAAYTLANTDVNEDDIPDYLDLDSDNDGWPDLREAGVSPSYDINGDARIDAPPGSVGNDGIADILQSVNDQACCDLDGDGRNNLIPINTDSADLPDFQDLDSDNDGIQDIIELGGSDSDNNGHVDNFVDVLGGKDGTDDGLLAFPYNPRDANGNGVFDHVEYIPSASAENDGETVDVVPDVEGLQPQADDPQPADEASQGVILTGLNASGCSIASSAPNSLLYLLTIISIAMLGRRYTLRRRSSPNQESKIAP